MNAKIPTHGAISVSAFQTLPQDYKTFKFCGLIRRQQNLKILNSSTKPFFLQVFTYLNLCGNVGVDSKVRVGNVKK